MSHTARKLYECSVLPAGWKREEICRKSGLSSGKIDVVYVSPSGTRCRTKAELARALGRSVDLTYFDFRSGRLSTALRRRQQSDEARQNRSHVVDYSRGLRVERVTVGDSSSFVAPIRQTASIFKQPVTVVRNFADGIVKNEVPRTGTAAPIVGSHLQKPRQLFWEKRLQGMRACDTNHTQLLQLSLPRALRRVGPHTDDTVAVRSLTSALHHACAVAPVHASQAAIAPITGQSAGKHVLDKNPAVFVDPAQPLVVGAAVSSEEVRRQEERVTSARKRLETAVSALCV